MRRRRAPLGIAAFVSLQASQIANLLIVRLQRLRSDVELGVEIAAELVCRSLEIVLALLLFAGADLPDPPVLQHRQNADQDHQQRHEEPQYGRSATDLIWVHHFLQ